LRDFLLAKLWHTLIVVFCVLTLVFVVLHLTGDPVMMMLPSNASREEIDALTRSLGLDQPLIVQYGRFLARVARGDFGVSLQHQQPAMGLVAERLPASLLLATTALVLAVAVALPLGMLAAARSVAVVLSGNRMLYDFGPGGPGFKIIGGGQNFGLPLSFRVSNPFLVLVLCTIILGLVLRMSTWGRHVFAIGGNEQAANLTGVPVRRVKFQVYVLCSLSAALGSILITGWTGSANNSLGQSYELLAIASAVIGGANLMGGEGTAYGAFVGSALIFVIRNLLLFLGFDSNWQGLFVGLFIVSAVLLERIRGKRRE